MSVKLHGITGKDSQDVVIMEGVLILKVVSSVFVTMVTHGMDGDVSSYLIHIT